VVAIREKADVVRTSRFGSFYLTWRNGFSLAATFEGEFSDVTKSYAGKGVVGFAW
jgi:hypothetical protein